MLLKLPCGGEEFNEKIMSFVTWESQKYTPSWPRLKMTSTFSSEEYLYPIYDDFTTETDWANFTTYYNDSIQG